MGNSRRNRWRLLLGSAVVIIVTAGTSAGLAYSTKQAQLDSVRSDNHELRVDVLSLQDEIAEKLNAYQEVVTHQKEIVDSLRLDLNDSIGDRLVITEATYEELPRTIAKAEAQGYSLLDKVGSGGELIEAACFAHEGTRHYAKRDARITEGVEWHGAPFLLMYNNASGKLMGMVLESTSPQPGPPWETHDHGHPGMHFPHSSLHIWFTDPPDNLSLGA
jgi:hypothetical protein